MNIFFPQSEAIPFLLPDNYYIFHTSILDPIQSSYAQYCLVCFIMHLLPRLESRYLLVSSFPDMIPISNSVMTTTSTLTILELINKLITQVTSDGRDFESCKLLSSISYLKLLNLSIVYAGLLGLLTTTNIALRSNYNPLTDINTNYWKVNSRNLESCKEPYHRQVLESVFNQANCIVTGGTGSGKTYTIPKLFYYYYQIYYAVQEFNQITDSSKSPSVVLSFPRRSLALENIKQYNICLGYHSEQEETNMQNTCLVLKIGKGNDSKTIKEVEKYKNSNPTIPTFVLGTAESLYELKDTKLLIIDEFHEHNERADILFSLAFKARIQLVIITATPTDDDQVLFKRFLPKAIRIDIASTLSHSITNQLLMADKKNYMNKVIQALDMQIPKISPGLGLLVFVPKTKDIDKLMKRYEAKKQMTGENYILIPYHSTVSEESRRIIDKYERTHKIIIFATPAAESSITFQTLVGVIDTGLEISPKVKHNEDYTSWNIEYPEPSYINEFQYKQRRGRVGRTQSGFILTLYDPAKLSKISTTVMDSNLLSLILLMKSLNLTINDLFVILTPERIDILNKVNNLITRTLIGYHIQASDINIEYLKSIFWIESLRYYALAIVPNSDKQLYSQLWVSNEDTNYNKVYNQITTKSLVPSKSVTLLGQKKGYYYFKNLQTNERIRQLIKTFPVSLLQGRDYAQVSIYYIK